MPILADLIRDTTTDTGTGTVTASGTPPSGHAGLGAVPTGAVVDYAIRHTTAAEYETGRGTIGGSNTLQRDRGVVTSSNSNALVSFSAGTKDISITVIGNSINTRGRAAAMAYALR